MPPCLSELPAEQLRSHQFVAVRCRRVRMMYTDVAELPPLAPGETVAIGDRVELLPSDCHAGKLSTITRLVPEPAQ